jgi:hypothetical protein
MTRRKAMPKCEVCGGIFEEEFCPFEKELPWARDYALMGKGELMHREHQRNVARWVLHGPNEHAENVVLWAKKKISEVE